MKLSNMQVKGLTTILFGILLAVSLPLLSQGGMAAFGGFIALAFGVIGLVMAFSKENGK